MKPWQVSTGITVAVCGVTVILVGEELHYLPSHLWLEHWEPIVLRGGLAVASLASGVYAAARVLGLAGLGRQTDLTERAIRRGHGDAEISHRSSSARPRESFAEVLLWEENPIVVRDFAVGLPRSPGWRLRA